MCVGIRRRTASLEVQAAGVSRLELNAMKCFCGVVLCAFPCSDLLEAILISRSTALARRSYVFALSSASWSEYV
eukprot:scaffold43641_cov183-Amphora_coffeaeformis.AAC.1